MDYNAAVAGHKGCSIITHPDDVVGNGRKRQWILDNVVEDSDPFVFLCDDNVTDLYDRGHFTERMAKIIVDRDVIEALIYKVYDVAKQLGTNLFGFASIWDESYFYDSNTWHFGRYINGFNMGIIGREQQFDKRNVAKEDFDFFLQTIYRHRFAVQYDRYGFRKYGHFVTSGGLTTVRNLQTELADIARLQRRFGKSIVCLATKRAAGRKGQVGKGNAGNRLSIKLPF